MITNAVKQFFTKYSDIANRTKFAVAVSGGPDSMALAHVLFSFFPDKKFHILSVNHGLRDEAFDEIKFVKAWSQNYPNAVFADFLWEGDKPETRVMEAARVERYRLISNYCNEQDIDYLFLGHHQDDQAETFLIRLSKGSGIDGLGAMSKISEYNAGLKFVRPLLNVSKEEILNYCNSNDILFVQDPSNKNGKYLRPRLREARDILEKEGLTSKRLSVTANRLARARLALDEISNRAYEDAFISNTNNNILLNAASLSIQPDEIRLRVLKIALEVIQPVQDYAIRYNKLEDLHEAIWEYYNLGEDMKRRSLGNCFFSYNNKIQQIKIEKDER